MGKFFIEKFSLYLILLGAHNNIKRKRSLISKKGSSGTGKAVTVPAEDRSLPNKKRLRSPADVFVSFQIIISKTSFYVARVKNFVCLVTSRLLKEFLVKLLNSRILM